MERRLRVYAKQPKPKTQDFSTVPVQGMFNSRPFVVQQAAEKAQQADSIKTSWAQANKYGHSPTQIQAPDSNIRVVQPKVEAKAPLKSIHSNQNQISAMSDMTQPIQCNIDTNGGTWTTDNYEPVPDGVEITLDFEPNDSVNAKKIGLIQKVLKVERGTNYDRTTRDKINNKEFTTDQEKRKDQRSDGESHIDRDIKRNNPIYGAPDLEPGEELSATPKRKLDMSSKAQDKGTAQNYQLGWRYKTMGVFPNKRSAKLYDKPNLPGATAAVIKDASKNSQMIFETTAVCIDGKQKGTYYGSVEWGFNINDKSDAKKIPLRKLTDGTPTEEMIGVMENWNRGEFAEGQQNPQIPIPNRNQS